MARQLIYISKVANKTSGMKPEVDTSDMYEIMRYSRSQALHIHIPTNLNGKTCLCLTKPYMLLTKQYMLLTKPYMVLDHDLGVTTCVLCCQNTNQYFCGSNCIKVSTLCTMKETALLWMRLAHPY